MNLSDAPERKRRWSALSSRPGSAGSNGLLPSKFVFKRPSSSGGLGNGSTGSTGNSSVVPSSYKIVSKRLSSNGGLENAGTNSPSTPSSYRDVFRRPSSSGGLGNENPAISGTTNTTASYRNVFKRPSSSGGLGNGNSATNTPATPSSYRNVFKRPNSSSGNSWRSFTPSFAMGPPTDSGHSGVGFPRTTTLDPAPLSSRSKPARHNSLLLIPSFKRQDSDQQNLDLNSSELTRSQDSTRNPFGKAFPSILGLSSLTLSRTSTRDSTADDKDRGRAIFRIKRGKSSSAAPSELDSEGPSRSVSRARSHSPFSFRFNRHRDPSPTHPQPIHLSQSEAELSDAASAVHPRSTAFSDDESGDETNPADGDMEDDSSTEDHFVDPITERNTERNAAIPPPAETGLGLEIEDPDPLGEGVNIVVAPEPYFPTTLNSTPSLRGKRSIRRRKTLDPLPFQTSRPVFQRDRCTITITQGDPESKLGERRKRRYVVASDLSEESRYAVEWGIGTVLRDGDEMWLVTVIENESKTDPNVPSRIDKTQKLRSQQERQGLAYILARQVTGLLQRTRLNVTILCQAWHAKNSRHMLLDIVDFVEPSMLIVGSRGLGRLRGILLGSTSHYLIQKCSVPVMVARRRLKRPPKKSAHLSTQRVRVKLAEAVIDRVAAKVDQDVKTMRDEMERDDNRRDGGPGSRETRGFTGINEDPEDEAEDEAEEEVDDEPAGIKVSG